MQEDKHKDIAIKFIEFLEEYCTFGCDVYFFKGRFALWLIKPYNVSTAYSREEMYDYFIKYHYSFLKNQ